MAKRVTRKDKAKDKALEDRMFNRLMDHIGPILADTFNKQNETFELPLLGWAPTGVKVRPACLL